MSMTIIRIPFPVAGGGGPSPSGADIVFLAGAEHETSAQRKFKATGSSDPDIASGVTGAHGKVYDNAGFPGGAHFGSNNASPPQVSTPCGGFRFRVRTDATGLLMRFYEGVNNHVEYLYIAGGSVEIRRHGVTIAGPSAAVLSLNTWYGFDARALIANSPGGQAEFKIYNDADGSELVSLSVTGADTQDSANAYATGVLTGSHQSDTYVDNVWAGTNGALLGGRPRVHTQYPNAAGHYSQLTRGGTNTGANYSQVNEATASETQYNKSTSTNQRDSYLFPAPTITGEIKSVQICVNTRYLSPAVSGQIKVFCRIGGTDYDGAITHAIESLGRQFWECFNNNPATGFAWTAADFASAEFGIIGVTSDVMIAQVVIEVLERL